MMLVTLLCWVLAVVVAAVIFMRVYIRRTVYCPLDDRLDDKTVLITGQSRIFATCAAAP